MCYLFGFLYGFKLYGNMNLLIFIFNTELQRHRVFLVKNGFAC
jgi:hypothetical protein